MEISKDHMRARRIAHFEEAGLIQLAAFKSSRNCWKSSMWRKVTVSGVAQL